MKKSDIAAFALIMGFVTVACMMPLMSDGEGASGGWSDYANVELAEVGGIYQINSEADLAGLSILVNGGESFEGETVMLMESIDMSAHYFIPIGWNINGDVQFQGTFDGNGNTISGLQINGMETSSGTEYQGLFGCIGNKGIVMNLTLQSPSITGTYALGGIAGSNLGIIEGCTVEYGEIFNYESIAECAGGVSGLNRGTIKDCSSNAFVDMAFSTDEIDAVSGVAGGIAGMNFGMIENSYNTGDVVGMEYVGGIAGISEGSIQGCHNTGIIMMGECIGGIAGLSEGSIQGCYNTGDVTSESDYAGGIAGISNGPISECYNAGGVYGPGSLWYDGYRGGIAGVSNNRISNCYNTGVVHGVDYVGGITGSNNGDISYCYNTGDVNAFENLTDPIFGINGLSGTVSNNYWLCNSELIEVLKGTGNLEAEQMSGSDASVNMDGLDFDNIWVVSNDGASPQLVTFSMSLDETVRLDSIWSVGVDEYNAFNPADFWIYHADRSWIYSEDVSTYYIRTVEELASFSYEVRSGNCFEGKTVNLVNDIDASGYCFFPIGVKVSPFLGTFNGNYYSISKLDLSGEDGITKRGLFRYIGNDGDNVGVVKNLTLTDTSVTGGYDIGGIAGDNRGIIENCHTTGTVTLIDCGISGGIAGSNYGVIRNCTNSGEMYGDRGIGGIVGVAGYGSTIVDCQNYGLVHGSGNMGYYGGIAGQIKNKSWDETYYPASIVIERCHNAASVQGYYCVGGIVGDMDMWSMVRDCHNGGDVQGEGYVGGISGSNWGRIIDCVNTGDVTGTYDYIGGIAGLNHTEFSYSEGEFIMGEIHGSSNSGAVTGDDGTGGIVGSNEGIIACCYNVGPVHGTKDASYYSRSGNTGGIAGYNLYRISECYNTGNISGVKNIGGLVGTMEIGYIYAPAESLEGYTPMVTDCYNTGEMSGESNVGGLVGNTASIVAYIANCYTTKVPTVGIPSGPICGIGTYEDCYWLIDDAFSIRSFATSSDDGGQSLSQMTGEGALSNMVGLDPTIWCSTSNIQSGDDQILFFPQLISFREGAVDLTKKNFSEMSVTYSEGKATPPMPLTQTGSYVYYVGQSLSDITPNEALPTGVSGEYAWEGDSVLSIDDNGAKMNLLFMPDNTNDYLVAKFAVTISVKELGDIWTADDLRMIGNDPRFPLDGHYTMRDNVIFEEGELFTPIGTFDDPFTGTFDGNGFAIVRMEVYVDDGPAGIFGYLSGNAEIFDLTVTGGKVVGNSTFMDKLPSGGIVGAILPGEIGDTVNIYGCLNINIVQSRYISGGIVGMIGSNSNIVNCHNEGSIEGFKAVGGIVGGAYDDEATGFIVVILYCENGGNVSGMGQSIQCRAGGIVGNMESDMVMIGCTNNGIVSASTGSMAYAGGIIGFASGTSDRPIEASDCFNSGEVSSSAPDNRTGGIFGFARYMTATNCDNSGSVSGGTSAATVSTVYVGGVVGRLESSNLEGCDNTSSGHVTVATVGMPESGASSRYWLGGIAGDMVNGSSIAICVNEGQIDALAPVGSKYLYIGGIVGHMYAGTSIEYCINGGEVSGQGKSIPGLIAYVGGVVGAAVGTSASNAIVANCDNNDKVTVTAANARVGGIMGYGRYAMAINCYNAGNVSGSGGSIENGISSASVRSGGVAGYLEFSMLFACSSSGDVKAITVNNAGLPRAGGIVGSMIDSVSLTDCIASGSIEANSGILSSGKAYAGGIAGLSEGTISSCTFAQNDLPGSVTSIGFNSGAGGLAGMVGAGSISGKAHANVMAEYTLVNGAGRAGTGAGYVIEGATVDFSGSTGSKVAVGAVP